MSLPSILVINPNTTVSVTEAMCTHAQRIWASQAQVHAATAAWGAPYISDEASFAVGAHAALDAWARVIQTGARPDAVLVGCFGDPGLLALRHSSSAPVTGLAEAAFAEAAAVGRFAIVTGGAHWPPMLARWVAQCGWADRCAGTVAVSLTGAQLAAQPEQAKQLLLQACLQVQQQWAVDAIILGGAALAGMAAALQHSVALPLVDSVEAGARAVLNLAGGPRPARTRNGFDVAWQGLGSAMTDLGLR